ncbi:DUF3012 domain-containing protein [Cellvibrio sp. OA-2007]|uniref:DUF3012 domain-containing protein n=1 Tax=Cellvibrio sp. OA-2007 TaxID=529823 RepID=UPI0007811071|nr:DUF3012 domain-containing protein [Cellvibrio sp. OA-2007]
MIQFFREQKLLAALLLLSILVIIAGVIMIQLTENNAQSSEVAAQEQEAQAVVETMTAIANIAKQELQDSQTPAAQPAVGDNIPQSSIDHVDSLNGVVPDVGSNDWCEVMMVKKSNEWTKEEEALFAQHCI